jgi:hypothetical protein
VLNPINFDALKIIITIEIETHIPVRALKHIITIAAHEFA